MDLEDFVKNTLVSITRGVHSANDELLKNSDKEKRKQFSLVPYKDKEHGVISFDVAVVVSKEAKKSGKGDFKVAIFNAGGKKSNSDMEEKVSHIRFNIIPQ